VSWRRARDGNALRDGGMHNYAHPSLSHLVCAASTPASSGVGDTLLHAHPEPVLFPPFCNDDTPLGVAVGGPGSRGSVAGGESPCLSVPSDVLVGVRDFTFSAWVRPAPDVTLRSQQCLFARERCTVGDNQLRLLLETTGQVDFWMNGLAGASADDGTSIGARLHRVGAPLDSNRYCSSLFSTTRLTGGRWTHVAVTRRNGVFSLWLNGVLEREHGTPGSAAHHASPEPFVVGGRPSPPHRGYLAIPPPHVDVFDGRIVCAGFLWSAGDGRDVMGWVGWARRRAAVIGCAVWEEEL